MDFKQRELFFSLKGPELIDVSGQSVLGNRQRNIAKGWVRLCDGLDAIGGGGGGIVGTHAPFFYSF